MVRSTISFYECEHQGDLNNILEDMGEFAIQFKDTESYDFIN